MSNMEIQHSPITRQIIENALDYTQYRQMIDTLLAANLTTGQDQSEALVEYSRMNVQRMNRIDKHISLSPELEALVDSINRPMIWLVLTEAWCGDAAQNLPIFAKIAALQPLIQLRFILRDENPELMDQFLTRSSRSIPKVIALDPESLKVLGHWGPRPAVADALVQSLKASGMAHDDYVLEVHKWYGTDKTRALQNELLVQLPAWTAG